VSFTNKTYPHHRTEILLKVVLNTITLTITPNKFSAHLWNNLHQVLWNPKVFGSKKTQSHMEESKLFYF